MMGFASALPILRAVAAILRDDFGQAIVTALWEFQLSGLRAEKGAGRLQDFVRQLF